MDACEYQTTPKKACVHIFARHLFLEELYVGVEEVSLGHMNPFQA